MKPTSIEQLYISAVQLMCASIFLITTESTYRESWVRLRRVVSIEDIDAPPFTSNEDYHYRWIPSLVKIAPKGALRVGPHAYNAVVQRHRNILIIK